MPFAAETCGYMRKEAVELVDRLGDIAAETGRIPKSSYKRVKGRSHITTSALAMQSQHRNANPTPVR